MADTRLFRFRAVGPGGDAVADVISAADRKSALRRLEKDGFVVTEISERTGGVEAPSISRFKRGLTPQDKVVVLRQLALMLRAGVDLLDALDTIGAGMGGEVRERLGEVMLRLRRGERLREAMRAGLPDFPGYVYALVELGQSTGRLDRVFDDAARQMEFEDRIRRDVLSSLTYPMFLITAGLAAVGFLFYEVVPRFAAMVNANGANATGLGGVVLSLGLGFRANAPLVLSVLGVLVAAVVGFASSERGRRQLYVFARGLPVLHGLIVARERATWARIMAFALGNGVAVLDATDLALASAPEGPFRRGLQNANRALRQGKRVDEALSERGVLATIDLSLLRAGQRSGALSEMFNFIGDRYEEALRQSLKRVMALVEPVAIGFVAIAIGTVALGLVTAMSSVYESVS